MAASQPSLQASCLWQTGLRLWTATHLQLMPYWIVLSTQPQACSAADLATGNYITGGMTVIITGPAGTGKSYFACALGDRACRNGRKVLYFTMNMLIENLKLVHPEGRETNFFRKLNAYDLLIIDDFGMVKLDGQIQHDFEQVIDDRYNRKALILASQLPVADWYDVFQSELIAEACRDRIVHKAIKFDLKGESLRKKY